jgi:sporulation protein YlmC with PRC-barrel domain
MNHTPGHPRTEGLTTADTWASLRRFAIATLLVPAALVAGDGVRAVHAAGPVQVVAVDVKAVAEGYRVHDLTGDPVENDKGEKIGTLDDIVVGHDKSLFAIVQVGGFLGLGGYLVAVPYDQLAIKDNGSKIVLANASKEDLKRMPEFQYKN